MTHDATPELTYDNVLVDIDGPVATLTLNRPEQLNALSTGLLDDLYAALRALNPGDDVRVIRLRGAGRAFCPGYDLAPTSSYSGLPRDRSARGTALADLGESPIARDRESLREMIDRWLWMWNYRKPVIAQTHGYCLSGGLDLIGACDIVFAAEGTLFGHPAARGMGIPVTLGMMPLKIGAAATKELLFTGDTIDAAEAVRIGLIAHVVAADELDERVAAFCQRVALNPLDVLTVHKHVTNRWSEVMNVRLAAFEGAEYDSIAHMTPSMAEFGRRTNEDGLRAALAWRDGPYSSGPAAEHDAAVRRHR
jgi:enoyl-CoA hydratase